VDKILDSLFNLIVAMLIILVTAAIVTGYVALLIKMVVFIFTYIWGLL
jgi:hypothetical protein